MQFNPREDYLESRRDSDFSRFNAGSKNSGRYPDHMTRDGLDERDQVRLSGVLVLGTNLFFVAAVKTYQTRRL